jgi:hypothetical protein
MMPKDLYNYKISAIAAFLLILTSFAYSQEEFTRNEEKVFNLSENSQFSISNKYGDIDIRDWKSDQIEIKAELIVRGVSKEKADEMLELINVNISQEGNIVKVETIYEEGFFDLTGKNFRNETKKFEVNYKIMLPAWLKASVENKYGDVFISRLNSPSSIIVKYGTLKINQLFAENKENMAEIDLAYSKGSIEECSWLRIVSSYSKLGIQEGKALVVVSKYSKILLERGSSIVCESKYDTYELGSISNFVTESKYSNIKIAQLSNKLILNTKYTDTKVDYIGAGFKLIEINNSYGSIKLGIDPNASYYLDGNAKYTRITYPDNVEIERIQENTDMSVKGWIGKNKNTKARVIIETNYGGVAITQ